MRQLITKILSARPQKLFLIDGFGALLSAFMLGIVLVRFEYIFGIPPHMLYLLALLPCFFAAYDFICFYKVKNKPQNFLKVIAIANILYCILSLSLAFLHRHELTYWGWIYLVLEVMIVVLLATIEFKTANRPGHLNS